MPSEKLWQELEQWLEKAKTSGKFYIMVNYVDQKERIQHYQCNKNFPLGDFMKSLAAQRKFILDLMGVTQDPPQVLPGASHAEPEKIPVTGSDLAKILDGGFK